MRRSKKILIIISSIVLLFIAFATWYKFEYSMDIAKAFELNTSDLNKSLLIATQSSDFKDNLVGKVIDTYKEDSIYIKVIDVGELNSIEPEISIMHC